MYVTSALLKFEIVNSCFEDLFMIKNVLAVHGKDKQSFHRNIIIYLQPNSFKVFTCLYPY